MKAGAKLNYDKYDIVDLALQYQEDAENGRNTPRNELLTALLEAITDRLKTVTDSAEIQTFQIKTLHHLLQLLIYNDKMYLVKSP